MLFYFILFQAIRSGVAVLLTTPVLRHFFNSPKLTSDGVGARAVEALEAHSRYKDTPWEYLESEGTEKCCFFGVCNNMCTFSHVLLSLQSTLHAMDPDLFGLTTGGTIKVVYLPKRPGRPA